MATVISLAKIAEHPMWGENGLPLRIEIDGDSATQFWSAVLLLAARHRATAIHYRPWHPASLTYVVGEKEYELIPPPIEVKHLLLQTVLHWVSGSGFRGQVRKLVHSVWPSSVAGVLIAEAPDARTEWVVVCYTAQGKAGVTLYRVDAGTPAEEAAKLSPAS